MIEKIVEPLFYMGLIYIGYKGFWEFVTYEPDYDEMHKSYEECPKCASLLYVEYGKWANMYRCKDCRFEGLREPIVYGIAQATSKRYKRLKKRFNNVR